MTENNSNNKNTKPLNEPVIKEAKANIQIIHDDGNFIERRDINSINSISAREAILLRIKQNSIQNSAPVNPTNISNSDTKENE
jgi:hypothetical protein